MVLCLRSDSVETHGRADHMKVDGAGLNPQAGTARTSTIDGYECGLTALASDKFSPRITESAMSIGL